MLRYEYPSTADYSYVNPDQTLVATRKLIQMCVWQAQSALPCPLDGGFQAVPTIVILFQ